VKPGNAGGGKGPQLKANARSDEGGGLAKNLLTPVSVQKLQTALHTKAKGSPNFRFYSLYDKVYRKDILAHAYDRCKANDGAAGVDLQEFKDVEKYGVERWLDELAQELKSRTYQPQAVRRVMIDKLGGTGKRPLGIPTVNANCT
jgi:RNA-directed DNA polymerase